MNATSSPGLVRRLQGGITELWHEVGSTLLIVLVVFSATHFVMQPVQVQGTSMFPTLQNGEYMVLDTLSYRLHQPQRGDIIVFHPPVDPSDTYVKRVIGIPGDRVAVRDGVVYLNGKPQRETYLHMPHTYSFAQVTVPRGDLFVLGDNRDISYDSHLWTNAASGQPIPFVAEDEVVGRAMVALWPLGQLHVFQIDN